LFWLSGPSGPSKAFTKVYAVAPKCKLHGLRSRNQCLGFLCVGLELFELSVFSTVGHDRLSFARPLIRAYANGAGRVGLNGSGPKV
jgi:hypothetical protein